MKNYYVGPYIGGLPDMAACIELIKEAGGRFIGRTPVTLMPGGMIYEAPAEVGEALGLLEWV